MRGARLAAAVAAATLLVACSSSGDSVGTTTSTTGGDLSTTTSLGATTSSGGGAATALDDVKINLQKIATIPNATALTPRSGDTALYVTDRTGTVRRITVTKDASGKVTYKLDPTQVLDISSSVISDGQEQGLLGIAFSTDGRLMYIAYTGKDSNQHVDEYTMGATTAVKSSRRAIITVDDFAPNHNGGNLVFGPDGFLYYGMGDGGGAGDPHKSGQNPNDLLGDILRIDPDGSTGGKPYGIPDGNPFANGGGAPEVYAYGLRNPWRFSFDRQTGDLWIGDVGQDQWEEVDWRPATNGHNAGLGANFGWSEVEGTHSYNGGKAPDGAVPPIYQYAHSTGGCSITGGFIYRGTAIPALQGVYLFADYCVGDIMGLVHNGTRTTGVKALGPHLDAPSSFGQDADGELYVLSLNGDVDKIVSG